MKKQRITEEMNIQEEWYKQASETTLDKLPVFINHLMEDYHHDYGTICHAITAGGLAAMHAIDHSETGGITGFQAGCIMWEFIRHWNYESNKTGLKILDYDKFLYPQYEYSFKKTISQSTWDAIKAEAQRQILAANEEHEKYLKDLEQYGKDIADFIEKYPDYPSNPKKYEHLGAGTVDEWNAEEEKEQSGFEFAPQKPYDGPYGNSVYKHWRSIVAGKIPFGYKISDEE